LDEEADKLNELMNKLLHLRRLKINRITVKVEEINRGVCKRYIDTFKIKYPDFNLNLISTVVTFYSDPVLFGQCFSEFD
jgi:two-component system phosphate regulon sensor histidine kinase PhoR